MEHNIPRHILSENDLAAYERFINKDKIKNDYDPALTVIKREKNKTNPQNNCNMFCDYFNSHIGKLIKLETNINNENKVGTLIEVGKDYIVIKPLNQKLCSIIIKNDCIKYITVIHDNDIRKTRAH